MGLSRPLSRLISIGGLRMPGSGPGFDPDAAAYVALVKAAGVTDAHLAGLGMPLWDVIEPAIDAFYVAEKAAGRWSLFGKAYFTIWGIAAANSLCMKTAGSGVFVNTPTHGAGFVKGNGTSSFFDFGISPASAGMTSTNGSKFAIIVQQDSRTDARMVLGARDNSIPATGECSLYQAGATTMGAIIGRVPVAPVSFVNVSSRAGVMHANRNASGLTISQRLKSGVLRGPVATATGLITTASFSAMAINNGGVRSLHTNASLGAYGFGLGLPNNAQVDAFTLNLTTLWETCTGLVLP